MAWFRAWEGISTDPKFQGIAKKLKLPAAYVIALWLAVLDYGSSVTQCHAQSQKMSRGNVTGFCADDFDVVFGIEDGICQRIYFAFCEKEMIVNGCIKNWDKRQPKREDTTAAIRKRIQRERERIKKNSDENVYLSRNVTQCHDRTDTDTDTDIYKKQKRPVDNFTNEIPFEPGNSRYTQSNSIHAWRFSDDQLTNVLDKLVDDNKTGRSERDVIEEIAYHAFVYKTKSNKSMSADKKINAALKLIREGRWSVPPGLWFVSIDQIKEIS